MQEGKNEKGGKKKKKHNQKGRRKAACAYPKDNVLAVGDAALDAAAVVCRRAESLLAVGIGLDDKRVVVLAAAHARA